MSLLMLTSGCAFLPAGAHRQSGPDHQGFLRGVFHVHSSRSHDSRARLSQIIKTGRRAGADFIVVTDHNTRKAEARGCLCRDRADPLILRGEEVSTASGHLLMLGELPEAPKDLSPSALADWAQRLGGWSVPAHPAGRKGRWRGSFPRNVAGLEVYSFGHALHETSRLLLPARFLFLGAQGFLRSVQTRPDAGLALWDSRLKEGRAAGFASADAHAHFQWPGGVHPELLLAFRSVTHYVPVRERTPGALERALGEGRGYMAFEARGSGAGFDFSARAGESLYRAGDTLPPESGPFMLEVRVPRSARIRVMHEGLAAAEAEGTALEHQAEKPGAYRVEVDRRGGLWILSNPIYKAGGGYLE